MVAEMGGVSFRKCSLFPGSPSSPWDVTTVVKRNIHWGGGGVGCREGLPSKSSKYLPLALLSLLSEKQGPCPFRGSSREQG